MGAARIDEDAELIWEGPLASVMRPMTFGTLRRAVVSGSILYLVASAGFLPFILGLVDIPGADRGPLVAVGTTSIVGGIANLLLFRGTTIDQLQRRGPVAATVSHLLTPVLIAIAVVAAGPNLMTTAAFYVAGPIYVFMLLQPRVAAGFLLFNLAASAVALALTDGVHMSRDDDHRR